METTTAILHHVTTMETSNSTATEYVGGGVWIAAYCTIISVALAGNVLTIGAIACSKHLSAVISNQFIFSLAVSDILVGLSVPYHVCFYIGKHFGHDKNTCLIRFVFISFGCSSSILNLFVIATDRYCAVVHPLEYNRCMTRGKGALCIALGWILSLTLSTVPIYWNHWDEKVNCDVKIIPASYVIWVLTPLFGLVWGIMILLYVKIWREAANHTKRMRSTSNLYNNATCKDTKSIQVVMLTLGCFSICWMPYFIVTTYYRIAGISSKFSVIYEIAFAMAVSNSGMNPVIYAWKNSNFREAFKCLLTCRSPNKTTNNVNYITNHVPSKKSSLANGSTREGHDNEVDIEMDADFPKEYDEHECSVSTNHTTVNSNL